MNDSHVVKLRMYSHIVFCFCLSQCDLTSATRHSRLFQNVHSYKSFSETQISQRRDVPSCLALDCPTPALLCVSHSVVSLCNLMDSSLPGSSTYGILQARIQEWLAISFSKGSSRPRDRTRDPALLETQKSRE